MRSFCKGWPLHFKLIRCAAPKVDYSTSNVIKIKIGLVLLIAKTKRVNEEKWWNLMKIGGPSQKVETNSFTNIQSSTSVIGSWMIGPHNVNVHTHINVYLYVLTFELFWWGDALWINSESLKWLLEYLNCCLRNKNMFVVKHTLKLI